MARCCAASLINDNSNVVASNECTSDPNEMENTVAKQQLGKENIALEMVIETMRWTLGTYML